MPDNPNVLNAYDELTERAAIEGVYGYISAQLKSDYDQTQVTIEYDELPPNLTGNWHLCVIPGGISPNQPHSTNTEIFDINYNFDLAMLRRVQDVPRDRKRKKFLTNLNSLTSAMAAINTMVDRNYNCMAAINEKLESFYPSNTQLQIDKFIEPPVLQASSKVRSAGSGLFQGKLNEEVATLVLTYRYTGLRRIVRKSAYPAGGPL